MRLLQLICTLLLGALAAGKLTQGEPKDGADRISMVRKKTRRRAGAGVRSPRKLLLGPH
jgi:hypothetical protein